MGPFDGGTATIYRFHSIQMGINGETTWNLWGNLTLRGASSQISLCFIKNTFVAGRINYRNVKMCNFASSNGLLPTGNNPSQYLALRINVIRI